MRNLKKLLAVVVAICVLATFTVPAFAADTTTTTTTTAAKTDAQIATDLGVIKGSGTGVTAEYLATTPDRVQAAIMFLRLKGLEDAAKAFVGTDNFADVAGLNDTNTAILAYLKANPDLGFAGVGDNKFAPTEKMTAKAYYKVLLVALGYTYEKDFTWANVYSFASSKGLVKLVDNETFTVNDLCIGTVEALKATVKGGTDTLIAKLVEGGSVTAAAATTSGIYAATAKALEVVSATTDNLGTAKFVFNKELDEDTVVVGNFETDDDIFTDVVLLDDNKTVLAIVDTDSDDAPAQSDSVDVEISDITATDGTEIADVTKTVTFVDTTIPTVTGVVAKNPKTLVITFSEPIDYVNATNQTLDNVEVDDSTKIGKTSFNYEKNTMTVIFASAMSVGTRKIDVTGMEDYAGYTAVTASFNVDVVADTTAPSIVSAKMVTVNKIDVTFNEELHDVGSFDVDDIDAADADIDEDDATIVHITLAKDLGIGATVEVKVEYDAQTDIMGNEVDSQVYTFKVADDTTLPTVKATFEDDNDIVLTFSKSMYTTAGTIKVLNADDDDDLLKKYDMDDDYADLWSDYDDGDSDFTEIILPADETTLDTLDVTNIKVVLEDMTDGTVRKNVLPDTTLTLTSYDGESPTIYDYYTLDSDDETVTFYFSEAMDTADIKNLSNYQIYTGLAIDEDDGNYSGETLKTIGASVDSVASSGKKVTIYIDNSYTALSQTDVSSQASFKISGIEDVDGNMADTTTVKWQGNASDLTFVTTEITATAIDTVKVRFNQAIGSIDPNLFYVQVDGGDEDDITFSDVDVDETDYGYVATFTTEDDMDTTTESLQLILNDLDAVADIYGNTLEEQDVYTQDTPYDIVDRIAPEIDDIDDTDDATQGAIKVNFSENVRIASLGDFNTYAAALYNDLIIKHDGSKYTPTASKVAFFLDDSYIGNLTTITAGVYFDKIIIMGLDEGETYTVTAVGENITDGDGNVLADEDTTSVVTDED